MDANVSVRPKGSQVLGIRSEVKNIGSINGVWKAVDFEINRHIMYRKMNKTIVNETRAWDAALNRTIPMRDKEVELVRIFYYYFLFFSLVGILVIFTSLKGLQIHARTEFTTFEITFG